MLDRTQDNRADTVKGKYCMDEQSLDYLQANRDYQRIALAIKYIEEHASSQPSLAEIAASIHLSEYHFQRLFQRWVGISPKRFLQHITREYAKQLLRESESILDTSYQTGLSSPGRLHDLLVTWEAVTPGEYKHRGAGMQITYGIHPSPFGECLIANSERGVCQLSFVGQDNRAKTIAELETKWPLAELVESASVTDELNTRLWEHFQGNVATEPLPITLRGTNFQLKIWEALLRIKPGTIVTYQDIAVQVGLPRASRAVGNAIGSNPIPVIIPCHRVIRKSGEIGNYRYGATRKKALLGWEQAKFGVNLS